MRPRTRRQWDDHYRSLYTKEKSSGEKSGGGGPLANTRGKRARNIVVDSEPIILNEDSSKALEKQDFIITDEGNTQHDASSEKKKSRTSTRNEAALDRRDVRGKKKVNVSYNISDSDDDEDEDDDDDDTVEYLGTEHFSNGSSSKIRTESRSKVGNFDEGVSFNTNRDGNTTAGKENWENSLDSKHIDIGSSESSDDSDKSLDLPLSENDDDDDDSCDEDYRVDKPSSSESLDVSDYDTDDNVPNKNLMKGGDDEIISVNDREKGSDHIKKEKDDGSDEGCNGAEQIDVIIIDEEKKSPTAGKSTKSITRSKGSDEGCHATHNKSDHKEISADKRKNEDVVIIEPSISNGARLSRIRVPHSRKDGDHSCSGPVTRSNKSKNADENLKDSGLKKRKAFGLGISKDSDDKQNDKEETESFSKSRKKEIKHVDLNDDDSLFQRDEYIGGLEGKRGPLFSDKVVKLGKKQTHAARNIELINILVESANLFKEQKSPFEENAFTQERLPTRFRFEDEVEPPIEKSEWEKEIDSLFHEMELGLRGSENDCTSSTIENEDVVEIDMSPAACCRRGDHQPILEDEIGIVCRYCTFVILDIKYVLPPFYIAPPRRRDRKDTDDSPNKEDNTDKIHFQDSADRAATDYISRAKGGTVWDLIPGVKNEMYPHQREGFEFIWKNIAGGIFLDKLKQPLSDECGKGCIISHAPGTGKTRLTIVFLAAFLKLYPNCTPVIIAPKGMLLAWESEFVKWKVNIPFHNMNKEELSENENAFATRIIGQIGGCGDGIGKEHVRWLKLCMWMQGRSVLGISYQLFEKLVSENREGNENEKMRDLLLEYPGLLVLDEGHTPRNDQSLIWKALNKVLTKRCIILSGTPFQNNLTELYNMLCLVNPNIENQAAAAAATWCRGGNITFRGRPTKKWSKKCIGKNADGLRNLKAILDPFVHVHKGTILEESLPGLRDALVFLHPTELQKNLLETSTKEQIFRRMGLISMVSVHPSLFPNEKRSVAQKTMLSKIESDIEAGVKTQFVMKLIYLAEALGERVLIFSQYIDPLRFIKKQIKSHFSWNERREILYMDGQLDERQRQDSISSFNDETSEAKVLLASLRACSEGINLVGASRVVLLDTVWNPSVEKQAISRAYRIGQKKVVYVYRLFTSGTEVRQYSQQADKERISQLIFSHADDDEDDGDGCEIICRGDGKSKKVLHEDKVLDAMLGIEGFRDIFERIIHQPKESDLIEIFGLVDL